MTRLFVALAATVCALVLLLSYRTPRIRHDPQVVHAAATPSSKNQAEVVAGAVESWAYGHLQVRVTLTGRRITDVRLAQFATTNPMSRRRSTAALTRLRGEVLSRQRADVDMVSGATYTSSAYLHSLQAALDTARWHR
jgi:uncharacterized protein with FMN-binding domain